MLICCSWLFSLVVVWFWMDLWCGYLFLNLCMWLGMFWLLYFVDWLCNCYNICLRVWKSWYFVNLLFWKLFGDFCVVCWKWNFCRFCYWSEWMLYWVKWLNKLGLKLICVIEIGKCLGFYFSGKNFVCFVCIYGWVLN